MYKLELNSRNVTNPPKIPDRFHQVWLLRSGLHQPILSWQNHINEPSYENELLKQVHLVQMNHSENERAVDNSFFERVE